MLILRPSLDLHLWAARHCSRGPHALCTEVHFELMNKGTSARRNLQLVWLFVDRAGHFFTFAFLHDCALRNYLGGAFCYVNREYSGRVKIILRSWRTANNVKEEEEKDPDAEEEEEAWQGMAMVWQCCGKKTKVVDCLMMGHDYTT